MKFYMFCVSNICIRIILLLNFQDCPQEKMGILIGKRGKKINDMIEQSGCHIVLHKKFLKVVITASTEEQLQVGRDMVQSAICSGPEYDIHYHYLCPIRRVGCVIGKKGTVIREIMAQSQCTIKSAREDITPDGQSQIFFISSNDMSNIQIALAAIQQIVNP